MRVEVKSKNYSASDDELTFTECCTAIVKTTDDNGNTAETEEKGCIIKGEEMIFLNSKKVYLPNLPTERQDVAGAFEEVLGKLQDAGGGDDWSPPEMPEPGDYEIYLLVDVISVSNADAAKLRINVASGDGNAYTGYGQIAVDWGDGTTDKWDKVILTQEGYPDYYGWSDLVHNYTDVGRYLVKISATEHSCFLQNILPRDNIPFSKVFAAKLGSKIIVNDNTDYHYCYAFYNQKRLQYVKMSGENGMPSMGFSGCRSLRKIDIAVPPQIIYTHQFSGCVNLKTFDFSAVLEVPEQGLDNSWFTSVDMPKCVSIGDNAFYNCPALKKINAPLCASVGQSAFANNYSLDTVTFAENCTFGSYCFSYCDLLYPRPDGSIN